MGDSCTTLPAERKKKTVINVKFELLVNSEGNKKLMCIYYLPYKASLQQSSSSSCVIWLARSLCAVLPALVSASRKMDENRDLSLSFFFPARERTNGSRGDNTRIERQVPCDIPYPRYFVRIFFLSNFMFFFSFL